MTTQNANLNGFIIPVKERKNKNKYNGQQYLHNATLNQLRACAQ